MKIIDSSTLIYCHENNISLDGEFYVIGDLDEEYDLIELIHSKPRTNVRQASVLPSYSEAYYLSRYAILLNKYGGYSFTGMRGFGDVAILALVRSYLDNFGKIKQISFDIFDDDHEAVTVVTDDRRLFKRLIGEFGGDITVLGSAEL